MMLMGDEYAHTRKGNNNSYGHDNAINHFQWGQVHDVLPFLTFRKQFMFECRKTNNFLLSKAVTGEKEKSLQIFLRDDQVPPQTSCIET